MTRKRTQAMYLPAYNSCLLHNIRDEKREERNLKKPYHIDDQFDIFNPNCPYYVKNALLSAGHEPYKLVQSKYVQVNEREDDTFLLGDSGGFQIATDKLKIDWDDPDPVRLGILRYLEENVDYAMTLDVPTFTIGQEGFKFNTFKACLDQTVDNLHFWNDNRNPDKDLKFLNVLQGRNEEEVEEWYEAVKWFPGHGWSFSSANSDCVYYMIRTAIFLADKGELNAEKNRIHVLGRTVPYVSVILTELQNRISEDVGAEIQITYDSASFKDAANSAAIYDPNLGPELKLKQVNYDELSQENCVGNKRTVDDVAGTKTLAGSALVLEDMYIVRENYNQPITLEEFRALDDLDEIEKYRSLYKEKKLKSKWHWPSQTYAAVMAMNIELTHQAMQNAHDMWDRDEMASYLQQVKDEIFPNVFAHDNIEDRLAELAKYKTLLLSKKFIRYEEPAKVAKLNDALFSWDDDEE